MGEENKRRLEQQLWNIANTLRGKMDADEFRDYILGFIFYKYLSEKMETYANELLVEDKLIYTNLDEKKDTEYLEAIKEDAIEQLGYFLKPNELFSAVAQRGNADTNNFILEDLTTILRNIESSTMGHESEDDFEDLFSDIDLTSKKLGRSEEQKNTNIHWSDGYYLELDSRNLIPIELKNADRNKPLLRGEILEMLRRTTKMVDGGFNQYNEIVSISIPGVVNGLPASNTLLSDASIWLDDLTNTGAGHYYDVENENMIIFAHSSIWPADPTPYGPVFEKLMTTTVVGDTFTITINGEEKEYVIQTRDRVNQSEYKSLQDGDTAVDAILFTCDADLEYRWVFKAEEI